MIQVLRILVETGCFVFGFSVFSRAANREPTCSSAMTRLQYLRQRVTLSGLEIALRVAALNRLS